MPDNFGRMTSDEAPQHTPGPWTIYNHAGTDSGHYDGYLKSDIRAGADLDFACWPLWCGSGGVRVDVRIAAQLAAHLCAVVCDDPTWTAAREALLPFAQTSHRADALGIVSELEPLTDGHEPDAREPGYEVPR